LSGWGVEDEERHRERVQAATQYLLKTRCKALADYLQSLKVHSDMPINDRWLSAHFHRFGVNMRHIAVVNSFLDPASGTSKRLCEDMIERALKNLLRFMLRVVREEGWSSTGNNFNARKAICKPLNEICSLSKFHRNQVFEEVRQRFGSQVPESLMDVFNGATAAKIVISALKKVGVSLVEETQASLIESFENFHFIPADIAFTFSNFKTLAYLKQSKSICTAFSHLQKGSDVSARQKSRIMAAARTHLLELQSDDPFVNEQLLDDIERDFLKDIDKIDEALIRPDAHTFRRMSFMAPSPSPRHHSN
jgi:hypothetical protein